MTTRTLPPEEAEQALKSSMLDIQIASLMPGELGFYAAHGQDISYMALMCKMPGQEDVTVWEITGGTKEAREEATDKMREEMDAEYQRRNK